MTFRRINDDILRGLETPGLPYFAGVGLALAVLALALFAFWHQVEVGLGVAGYQPPILWAVYITNFVFWVGITHSGTLVSAVLYLCRARWRTGIARASEAMTVFAIMTAGLFPIIHLGRPRDQQLHDGQRAFPVSGSRAGHRRLSRPHQGLAATCVRSARAGLAWHGSAVASFEQPLRVPRRARDAARRVGAQRGVVGLCHGAHPGLAQHDLRALLRRGRHLLRRRDDVDAPHPRAAAVASREV